MTYGLSDRQARLLALLIVSKRPLDVMAGQVLANLGVPATDSGKKSLRRSVRSLERRGLVKTERRLDPRKGGWGQIFVSARRDAEGALTGADRQRALSR
jgi:predicted transcriptional regulator